MAAIEPDVGEATAQLELLELEYECINTQQHGTASPKDITLVCWNTNKGSDQGVEKKLRDDYIVRYLSLYTHSIIFLQESLWSKISMPVEVKRRYHLSEYPYRQVLLMHNTTLELEPWPIKSLTVNEPNQLNGAINKLFSERATAVATKTRERVGFVNVHFMQNKYTQKQEQETKSIGPETDDNKKCTQKNEQRSKCTGKETDENKKEMIRGFLNRLMANHTSQAAQAGRIAGSIVVAADWNIEMEKLEGLRDKVFVSNYVIHNTGTGLEKDGIIEIWPKENFPSLDVTAFFYDKHVLYNLAMEDQATTKPADLFDHTPLRCTFTHQEGHTIVSWNQFRINKQHQPLTDQQLTDAKVYVEGYMRSIKPKIIFVQNSNWNPGQLQQLMPAGREYEATTVCATEIILYGRALGLREWDIQQFRKRAAAVQLTRGKVIVGFVAAKFAKGKPVRKTEEQIKTFLENLFSHHKSQAEESGKMAGSIIIAADWCISMEKLECLLLKITSLKHVIHNSGHKKETDGIVEIWPENIRASWDVTEFFYDKLVLYNLATGNAPNSKSKDLFDRIPLRCTATFTDHHEGT